MKRSLFITIFLYSAMAFGQQCVPSNTQSCTPNVQLATPFVNAPNWNVPLIQNFTWLDSLLSGNATASGFNVAVLSKPNTFTGTITQTAPGSFAGTTQLDYFQSLINGCSPAALEAGFGGPNPVFEEAIVGCAAVPGTATKVQVDGIAGLVTNSGTTTRTVGVFGLANALVANTAGVWGANFAVSSFAGFGGNPIYAAENDCNVANTTDICYGLLVAGNWTAQPTNSYGLLIAQPGPNSGTSGTNHWPAGLFINTGATAAPDSNHCGVCFNPVGTGVNKQSQGMTFVADDPSAGLNVVSMGELPNGNFYISNTKAGTGLQVNGLTAGLTQNATNGIYQSKRGVSGCTTAASIGGVCATPITVTWPAAFADTNYSVTCSPSSGPTNLPAVPFASAKATGSATVNYFAISAAAASWGTIDCEATHD